MDCAICHKSLAVEEKVINCEHCNSKFHEEELAIIFQKDHVCLHCKEEFDPYLVFELTDKYDITAKEDYFHKNQTSTGIALLGIFGILSPRMNVILIGALLTSFLIYNIWQLSW